MWNECTIVHRKPHEALDKILQNLRKNTRVMGEIVLQLSEDFWQILPIVKNQQRLIK